MKRRLGAARLGLTREITAMPAQTFATGPNAKAQESNTLSYEGYTKVWGDEFDGDSPIFEVDVNSSESTKATNMLKKLLNTKDHAGCYTIDEICQKLAETKLAIGNFYDFVHHELLIKALLRKIDNKN